MNSRGSRSPAARAPASPDARFLAEALALGHRGLGRTSPNPPVGALVVRGGRIVGRGWHRRAGTPHAEVLALREAGERARGATLYVTLEPCCHQGRTPPCAPAVAAAGIRRVVVGARDPDPRVAGGGIRSLRRSGLEVVAGIPDTAAAAAELIRFFAHRVRTGRPFVRLKLATSQDGRIATASGASRWITGSPARRVVHQWRDEFDVVMVGSETVLVDDPALTCRRAGGRDPLRVVVDGRLRTPVDARLLREGRGGVLLAARHEVPTARVRSLTRAGADVWTSPRRRAHIDLLALLVELANRGANAVLVEGGAGLAAALLSRGLVDEIAWFTAPVLLGGDGRAAIASLGVTNLRQAVALELVDERRLGLDWLRLLRPAKT